MGGLRFDSTVWTIIREAGQKDPRALEQFALKYREPVVTFIRQQGFPEQDAEDLAQEVFVRIFKNDVLQKADACRGRFRNLLIAVTKNLLYEELRKRQAAKRGGGQAIVSLDAARTDEESPEPVNVAVGEEDPGFQRLWMTHVLSLAMDRLRRENENYYQALHAYVTEGLDYNGVAEKLNTSLQNVKNYLRRGRLKLLQFVREEIASYSSSTEEYDAEVSAMWTVLGGAPPQAQP